MSEWVWQGHKGHLIVADDCRFGLATRVGDVLVSTIGDYYCAALGKERQTLGASDDSFFETMVFPVRGTMECGCAEVSDWSEIDSQRYATAQEATTGHLAMCREWEQKQREAKLASEAMS